MKHYTTVTIPEYEKKKLINTTCDICGKAIKTLPVNNNDIEEVIISYEKGVALPEYDESVKLTVDMYADCFKVEFLRWLKTKAKTFPQYQQCEY